MDMVMEYLDFRKENGSVGQQGRRWEGGVIVPSTGKPLEETVVSIYFNVETPWELRRLDGSLPIQQPFPKGMYCLTFRPNSPAALKQLIIDPDPGGGETI